MQRRFLIERVRVLLFRAYGCRLRTTAPANQPREFERVDVIPEAALERLDLLEIVQRVEPARVVLGPNLADVRQDEAGDQEPQHARDDEDEEEDIDEGEVNVLGKEPAEQR